MVSYEKYSRKISIGTNSSCNLRCVYCYERDKKGNVLDVELIKKRLIDVLAQRTKYGTLLDLHGGEPFLVFKELKNLCEWIWSQNFKEDIMIHLTTNGTLVHGYIQDWLYRNRFRLWVKLSLDGNKSAHNLNRSNSFDLIDIPFFVKTWPHERVKMTLTPQTIVFLYDSIRFLHSSGFKNISVDFAEITTDWSCEEIIKEFEAQMTYLVNFYILHKEYIPCSLFIVPFERLLSNNSINQFNWCSIGSKIAYDVDTNKIYPCHLFFESVCGREKSCLAQEIDISVKDNLVSKECWDCKFIPICPTCYGANLIARGSLSSRDMNMCKIHKIRFRKVAEYEFLRIKELPNETSNNEKILNFRKVLAIRNILHLLYS